MKRFSATLLAGLLVFVVVGCKNEVAAGYKFMTPAFEQAVSAVNADAFFGPPLPPPPPHKDYREAYKTDEAVKKLVYGKHYEAIGENLCKQIESSYLEMLRGGISSKNSFAFDEDLIKLFRNKGAYILPLEIYRMNIDATFKHARKGAAKARNALMADYRKLPSDKRIANSPKFEGQNQFKALLNGGHSVGDFLNFRKLLRLIDDKHGFKLKEFNGNIEYDRTYLFIFNSDKNDIHAESVYFYVVLPALAKNQIYGQPPSLSLPENAAMKINCYARSKSSIDYRLLSSPILFDKTKLVTAPVGMPEPLSRNPEYKRPQIPAPDGSGRYIQNDGYVLKKEDIASPSLKCWYLAFAFAHGDYNSCLNSGYAESYQSMLNENLCIWKNKITKPNNIKPPYQIIFPEANANPEFGYTRFLNICEPNFNLEPNAGGKDD